MQRVGKLSNTCPGCPSQARERTEGSATSLRHWKPGGFDGVQCATQGAGTPGGRYRGRRCCGDRDEVNAARSCRSGPQSGKCQRVVMVTERKEAQ